MPRSSTSIRTPGAGAALTWAALLLVASASPANAQRAAPTGTPDIRMVPYSGLGYSANLPGVITGLGIFHLEPRWGLGVFANVHYSLDSPEGDAFFFDDRTAEEARDDAHMALREREVYRSVSAGVIWPFDPEIAAYVGLGFTRERIFEEFEDPLQEMGDFGHYWVEDPTQERDGVNVTAGLFFQAGRHLFFRVGGELFPLGGSLGVYAAIPR
jgi:hypothetical protein